LKFAKWFKRNGKRRKQEQEKCAEQNTLTKQTVIYWHECIEEEGPNQAPEDRQAEYRLLGSNYPAHEAEELVVKARERRTAPTMIGLELRDSHGIPSVKNLCGKSVTQILEANSVKLGYPDDFSAHKARSEDGKHMKVNKADGSNRTKLIHVESKIQKAS